jgi:hypothetical protein
MMKPLNKKALLKEAAFWANIKKQTKISPGKSCLK